MEKLNAIIERTGDSFTFIASSPNTDRLGDQVMQDFDLEQYLANPVVLFGHDHSDPVGKCLDARIENGNLVAEIEFAPTTRGQEIAALVDHGTLRALSIGFTPGDTQVNADGGFTFQKNSLVEISIVPVPANPDALRIKSTEAQIMSDTLTPTPELKIVPMAAQEGLMQQISKALPALQSGQSFRTEIARKAIAGPINSGATSTIALPPQFAGLVNQTLAVPNRLYDLVSKLPASGQSVNYVQVALDENNAAVVPELGLKPSSEMKALGINVEVQTFAHWTEASKQILADVSGLQALIGSTLVEGVTRIVDAHLYSVLSANSTAFIAATDAADIVAEATLSIQMKGGNAPIVLVNPSDYLAMMTQKASGSGEYLGLSQMPQTVVASPSVAVGKILAFDPSAVCYFEREMAGVFIGYSGDQFVRNAATVLAELRGVGAVLNPNLVLFGDLPPARQATTVNTGETPPLNPLPNTLWFRSSDATMMIWYDNAWVQISSGAAAAK
jgi:HK97 family phage prohead protease